MNTLKIDSGGREVSIPEGAGTSLVDRAVPHSCAPSVIARDVEELSVRSIEIFPRPQTLAKPKSLRAAIKVGGKILFIDLGDVASVQAKGKCVWLHRNQSSYLLHESITVLAERLETHGFIRIHRSVLVNAAFVQEIRPLSTGEYCLRVDSGKEYRVTRTYKKNLKSLAEFWIGKGALFPG